MFDLNETINWKPKSTGEGRFGNWIKMLMIGTYPVQGIGDSVAIWRTEDKQEEILIPLKVYNEIEKSIAAGVQNPFKGFK
jgi:isoleucyl-tRNA synthetase